MSYYIPGKPLERKSRFLESTPNAGYRTLVTAEFAYYYGFLQDEELKPSIKAGLAMGLLDDLRRLYKENYSLFRNPLVESWVEQYLSYPEDSLEFQESRQEYSNFNYWNRNSNPEKTSETASLLNEQRLQYILDLADHAVKENDKLKLDQLLNAELQTDDAKKKEKLVVERAKIVAASLENHIRNNIRGYLSGIYDQSPGKLFIAPDLAKAELDARKLIIGAVENNEINPVRGLDIYREAVDSFVNVPKPSKVISKVKQQITSYLHPFARIKRRDA